ncbi:hypothetical protein L6452_45150 [Arctium lappa]|nr:hypothetical protein L6452_45150 [Arctium lappa]
MGIVLQGGPHDSSVARAWPTTRAFGGRGPYCWSANRRRAHARIPLVRTILSWLFDARWKAPEEAVPNPSPGRHAATRSRRGSSSSSPPTADGFGTGTPRAQPSSQSFSRGYGSILPTSLAYIVPSTRGCSPWRPDAVMSTTGAWEALGPPRFSRAAGGAPDTARRAAALPAAGPYLRLSRFQGSTNPCASAVHMEPFPSSAFKVSFEYLLLPPRSAPTAAPPGLTPKNSHPGSSYPEGNFGGNQLLDGSISLSPPIPKSDERFARQYRCGPPPEFPLASPRSGIVHHLSVPTGMLTLEPFSEDQGRSAVHPRGGSRQSASLRLAGLLTVDSHTCQTPWSVFQDGPNGVPAGRCREHAGAEARRDGACCQPRSTRRHLHGHINSPGFGRRTNPHGPRPESIGVTGSRPSLQDDTLGSLESASLASARLDTKALTTTTSRASVKGDSFLGQPHHGHGRPVSAPNDTHPHWGGVVGGDAMRDAQADVPSAEWLRAQLAFKNSMVHGILQFTPSIRILLRSSSMREPRYPLPRVVYGLMRGHDPCTHRKRGNTEGRALLKFGFPWHMPFQWNSRDVAGGEPPTSPRSYTSPDHSIGRSDGRCVQRAGT